MLYLVQRGLSLKQPDRSMLTFAVLWARYDAATDRWLTAATMMSRRYALGAAALDNCVYAVRCIKSALAHAVNWFL